MAKPLLRARYGSLVVALALASCTARPHDGSGFQDSGCGPDCGDAGSGDAGSDADASAGTDGPGTSAADSATGGDPSGANDGGDASDGGSSGAGSTDASADGGGDSSGGGGGCSGGEGVDRNGVAYVDIPGFTYEGALERFDWSENFQSGGSMRHDFEGTPEENQCVLGYFVVDGPDGEEISAKLGGGPHNNDNPDWADTHDLGIINFVGDRSRVRWEETHPDYDGAVEQDVDGVGDVRGKWVGAMGCKLNLDKDQNGEPDHVWYLAWVDPEGLDGQGLPVNGWVKVLDAEFAVEDVGLKSPTVPYVVTIGEQDEAQATMRIDEQGDSYEYDYIAYRSPVPCP